MSVPPEQYPDLVAAYEDATAAERDAMRAMVETLRSERPGEFLFSFKERDDYLAAGGFCVPTWFRSSANCRPVPPGEERIMEAFERFQSGLEARTPPRIAR